MNNLEEAALIALVTAVPAIGRWIANAIDGMDEDPEQTRRVRDILPSKSASMEAVETLREMGVTDRIEDTGKGE